MHQVDSLKSQMDDSMFTYIAYTCMNESLNNHVVAWVVKLSGGIEFTFFSTVMINSIIIMSRF